MKKFFVGVLAIAGLVACAQEDVLRTQAPGQIAFDGAWVGNSVRTAVDPSFHNANNPLTAFDVWGYMDNGTGLVFDREEVSGGAGAWDYVNKQYWVPGHKYRFFALAPAQSENVEITLHQDAYTNAIQTLAFTNVDGSEDLLYASATRETPATVEAQPEAVKFAFDHLLSKVKFTFTNGIENENAYIVVTNVKMVAPKTGTIALNVEGEYAWTANFDTTLDLVFGDLEGASKIAGLGHGEADHERLTIPAAAPEAGYVVTFDTELFMGGVSAGKASKTTYIKNITLEPGKAYNFKATLSADNVLENELFPITFEAEVEDWITAETPNDQVIETELAAALQFGGEVTLTKDETLSQAVKVANNLVVNLNGHTLTYTGNDVLFRVEGATVTINGAGSSIVTNPTTPGTGGNGYVALVKDGGVLNINGGVYDAQGTCTVAQVSNGTLNVYGGTFSVNMDKWTDDNGEARYLFNCTDAPYKNGEAVINVYGGKFYKFNPANNASEGVGTDLVPEGYAATANVDYYEVYSEQTSIKSSYDGKTDGLTVTAAVNRKDSENGIFNLTSDATISNVTIDGQNLTTYGGKGLRGIFINGAGTYNVENVKIQNCAYAINVNTTKDVVLNVSNSTLEGWTSHGSTTVATYNTVSFTVGTYYAHPANTYSANDNGLFRPYGEAVLTNCAFADGFVIDLSAQVDGKTITFVNCTYNGAPLTEANLSNAEGKNYEIK